MSTPFKVAIVGANGKIARLLVNKLKSHEKFEPLAIIRNPSQVEQFQSQNVQSKVVSLEDSVKDISNAISGCNAIVFSAGAGGKGGADNTVMVDLDGAVKVMEAAEISKIKRFIIVSAIQADNRDFWYNKGLRTYYICKKYADSELRRTKLDWTILQPGALIDTNGTGKVSDDYGKQIEIPREDVANAIVGCLEDDSTIHKTITIVGGDVPIKNYLANLE